MKRRIACTVAATLTSVVALSASSAEIAHAETVTALPGGGWFDDPRGEPDQATSRLVTGPGTPPEGNGSLELGVNAANEAALVTHLLLNDVLPPALFVPFDGLTGSWSTYVPAGGNAQFGAPSVRLEAYTRGTLLSDYMTVIVDPVFQGTVTLGQWQTWEIDDEAVVYQTRDGERCDQVVQCTLAEFQNAYPQAAFFDVQLGVGSFVSVTQPIVSNVDALHLTFTGGSLHTNFDVALTSTPPEPPVAAADSYATLTGHALAVSAASGVLLNDIAQNGHGMTAAVAVAPTSGALQLSPDGSFTYTPNSGFTGTDSFTYAATDVTSSLASPPATVTIEVTPDPAPIVEPKPPPEVNGSQFVPVSPVRLVDTRTGLGATGPLGAASTTVIATGAGGVPSGATAIAVNITATEPTSLGYIQAFPTGSDAQGDSSNLNVDHRGQTVADFTLVGLDAAGTFSVFSQPSTHLVIDVFGYFVPVNTATSGRLVAVAPVRVLDTRVGVGTSTTAPVAPGGSLVLSVAPTVPADASAVVMTLTATNSRDRGYIQAIPTGGSTVIGASSNINVDRAGDTTANTVIVPLGANSSVTLYSQSGADLVADVVGYFTGASAPDETSGLFIPITPQRLADTRVTGVVATGGSTITVPVAGRPNVPAPPPTAIAGTITVTETSDAGFEQAFPSGSSTTAGSTSSINFNAPGRTVGVASIVGTSTGSISLYSHVATHVVYDISGYFI